MPKKDNFIKIKAIWTGMNNMKIWKNSGTRIKEDKEVSDGCKTCGLYKTNPGCCSLDYCPEIGE